MAQVLTYDLLLQVLRGLVALPKKSIGQISVILSNGFHMAQVAGGNHHAVRPDSFRCYRGLVSQF
jgi:hypothetical protein